MTVTAVFSGLSDEQRQGLARAADGSGKPRRDGGALHHQLYILLRHAIVSGAVAPGAPLPGENVLAATHVVSRVTVRRALERLTREGLVVRVQGAGNFVADAVQPVAITADLNDHLSHVAWLAEHTEVTLLRQGRVVPPAGVATAMMLAPGETVEHVQRVRAYRGAPFLFLDSYMPARVAVRIDPAVLRTGSLHHAITRAGFVFGEAEHVATAIAADATLAEALRVPVASPLLLTSWTERDTAGGVLQYHLNYARPDLYVLRTRFATASHL